MKKLFMLLSLLISLSLTGCGGGGSSETYSMTGSAQKGPLIFGSYVWVSELDNNLNSIGKTYITQTTDNLGNFKLGANITSNLVEIIADGYFMDETTGSLSTAKFAMSAIADLRIDNSPTVNILTTLQVPRLKTLMTTMSYSAAFSLSQNEILAAFGINSSSVNNLNGLFSMEINGTEDPDSVLLATSAILMQMAATQASSTGASKAAELSYFISQISNDISSLGALSDSALISKISSASSVLDLTAVRTNVETYYANKGVTIVAPKFEEWVDKDGSSNLPRRQISIVGVVFNDTTAVEALTVNTSNKITVSGVGSGGFLYVDTDTSGSLVKNNSVVSGTHTTAVDGDEIAVRLTSGSFGISKTAEVTVGSTNYNWSVTTKTPTIQYKSSDGNFPFCCAGIPGDDAEKYHAFPIQVSENFTAKYIGSSFNASSDFGGIGEIGFDPEKVSIYSDNSGLPGTELISTINFGDYFGTGDLLTASGATQQSLGSLGFEGYLGSTGLQLNSGDKVWIVFKFTSAVDPGMQGNSPVGFSARKVSSDGSSWSNYQGLAYGRYSDQMPMVMLTD